jgi:GNAT superfamily N-acetyltransferase
MEGRTTAASSTCTDVLVRRAGLEDQIRLGAFYVLAYPGKERWKYPERWQWEYIDNPFRPDDRTPLWIAEQRGQIIGQTGAMYVQCKVGGQTVRAAWSVDTIVLPEHRGKGQGRKLQEANQQAHDLFISLAMSDANRAVKQKIGGRRMRGMSQYACVHRVDRNMLLKAIEQGVARRVNRRIARVVRTGLRWTGADFLASLALGALLQRRIRQAGEREPVHGSVAFQEVSNWSDGRLDELWAQARSQFDFAVERSSAYLRWKYHNQPWVSYSAAFAMRGPKVVGLVVYRAGTPPEPRAGTIAELISVDNSPAVYEAMAKYAVRELEQRGANAVLAGASDTVQQQALRQVGFIEYGQQDPMVGGNQQLVSQVEASERVMLSMGDHDVDQYPNMDMPSVLKLIAALLSQ